MDSERDQDLRLEGAGRSRVPHRNEVGVHEQAVRRTVGEQTLLVTNKKSYYCLRFRTSHQQLELLGRATEGFS